MAQAKLRPSTFGHRSHLWQVGAATRVTLDMVADHLHNYAGFSSMRRPQQRELGGFCEGALRSALADQDLTGSDWTRIDRVRRDIAELLFYRSEDTDWQVIRDHLMQLGARLVDDRRPRAEHRRLCWWRDQMPRMESFLPVELRGQPA